MKQEGHMEDERKTYHTPTTMDAMPPKSEESLRKESYKRPHRTTPGNLRDQVTQQDLWNKIDREKHGCGTLFDDEELAGCGESEGRRMWPTAIADDTGMRKKPYSQGGHPLSYEVSKAESADGTEDTVKTMWRTPKSKVISGDEEYNEEFAKGIIPKRPSGNPVELTLENQIKIRESYPTPIAHDAHKAVPNPSMLVANNGMLRRGELANHITYNEDGSLGKDVTEENRGQLNPDWVEWLMGWPVGWTSLKPMAKEHFEKWRKAVLDGTYWDEDPANLQKDDENYVPRLTTEKDFRANRLEAIGNGQVPQCIFFAEGLMDMGGES